MLNFNSGMGYGMYGGMGMMQMKNTGSSGNYWQQIKTEYGCEDCFQHGPTIPECHFHVMPLPPKTPHLPIFKRITRLFGF